MQLVGLLLSRLGIPPNHKWHLVLMSKSLLPGLQTPSILNAIEHDAMELVCRVDKVKVTARSGRQIRTCRQKERFKGRIGFFFYIFSIESPAECGNAACS